MEPLESYLFTRKHDDKPNQSIDEAYPDGLAIEDIVIRDEELERYIVFHSKDKLIKYMDGHDKLHECIFGNRPHKFRLDIDAKRSEGATIEIARELVRMCIKNLADICSSKYGVDDLLDHVIQAQSDLIEENNEVKYSYHIIFDTYLMADHFEDQYLFNELKQTVDEKYHKFMDGGIYKSHSDFRMVNSCKLGSKRKLKLKNESILLERTLVTYTEGCKIFEKKATTKVTVAKEPSYIANANLTAIREVLENDQEISTNHRFRDIIGTMLVFNRINPSYCDICARQHDRDHTLRVRMQAKNKDNSIVLIRTCIRNSEKSVVMGSLQSQVLIDSTPASSPEKDPIKKKWTEYRVSQEMIRANKIYKDIDNMDQFSRIGPKKQHVYNEPTLRPFELVPNLCVRAAMKMGKTKALKKHIDTYFSNKSVDPPTILFLSFRLTFSSNINENFEGFTLYSDVRGPLVGNRLICSIESLHRFEISNSTKVDLLILDESESIFEQFDSGLSNNFAGSFATFEWLMRYSKHVICMDANLSNKTYFNMNNMRPNFCSGDSIVLHENLYQNQTADTYDIYYDFSGFLYQIDKALTENQRIVIASSSLREAKAMEQHIKKKFPTKSCYHYNRETLTSIKKEHFGNVNKYWVQFDVVIYTPTLTAGVSFEMPHFDQMFCYFTDMSCSVETCIQMTGRPRDIKLKQYHIFLNICGAQYPTTAEAIESAVTNARDQAYRPICPANLMYEYGPIGEIKYHKSNYFKMWIQNEIVRNLSKNNFAGRLINLLRVWGATVRIGDIQEYDDGDYATTKKEVRMQEFRNIATAIEIDSNQAQDIRLKTEEQVDVSAEEQYAYKKYMLRTFYNFKKEITVDFVMKYDTRSRRAIYRNLCEVATYDSSKKALADLSTNEKSFNSVVMNKDTTEYLDLKKDYLYNKNRIGLSLLKICGWSHLRDDKIIYDDKLIERLRSNSDLVETNLKDIRYYENQMIFTKNLNIDNNDYLKKALGDINMVLKMLYHTKIEPVDKKSGAYRLAFTKLFVFEDSETKPTIHKRQTLVPGYLELNDE